jgi:hypothetical protein
LFTVSQLLGMFLPTFSFQMDVNGRNIKIKQEPKTKKYRNIALQLEKVNV